MANLKPKMHHWVPWVKRIQSGVSENKNNEEIWASFSRRRMLTSDTHKWVVSERTTWLSARPFSCESQEQILCKMHSLCQLISNPNKKVHKVQTKESSFVNERAFKNEISSHNFTFLRRLIMQSTTSAVVRHGRNRKRMRRVGCLREMAQSKHSVHCDATLWSALRRMSEIHHWTTLSDDLQRAL